MSGIDFDCVLEAVGRARVVAGRSSPGADYLAPDWSQHERLLDALFE